MATHIPGSVPMLIKGGTGWVEEDVIGMGYSTVFVASAHLSAEAVYHILKVLWAHYQETHAYHPWLRGWSPEQMFTPDPLIPYHEGAVLFFKEQGLWVPEVEQRQQGLLAKTR